jgi:hypothetical protein
MFRSDPTLNAIDDFAYSACQSQNFGDRGKWFLAFRLATSGFITRRAGAEAAFRTLTEWLPGMPLRNHEHELALCLFNMDSALECWVFALNAIGYGVRPTAFLDMTSDSQLKRISPDNIFGKPTNRVAGYDVVFPTVAAVWRARESMIRIIIDNHDVSKHRYANFWGGQMRSDPPPEILHALGVASASQLPLPMVPMQQVLLPREPKLAFQNRSGDLAHWIDLVDLKKEFDAVMDHTTEVVLSDLRTNVALTPAAAAAGS